MEARDFLPHHTCSDYLNWEGRWELLQGIPYYLLLDPVAEEAEVYFLQQESYQPQGHAFRQSFTLDGSCLAEIDFGRVWVGGN